MEVGGEQELTGGQEEGREGGGGEVVEEVGRDGGGEGEVERRSGRWGITFGGEAGGGGEGGIEVVDMRRRRWRW